MIVSRRQTGTITGLAMSGIQIAWMSCASRASHMCLARMVTNVCTFVVQAHVYRAGRPCIVLGARVRDTMKGNAEAGAYLVALTSPSHKVHPH